MNNINVEEWLNIREENIQCTCQIKQLLNLYLKGIHQYKGYEMTSNHSQYVKKLDHDLKSKGDNLFKQWVTDSMIVEMKALLTEKITECVGTVSLLKLEIKCISESLEFFKDGNNLGYLRSDIINGISDLKELLLEVSNSQN